MHWKQRASQEEGVGGRGQGLPCGVHREILGYRGSGSRSGYTRFRPDKFMRSNKGEPSDSGGERRCPLRRQLWNFAKNNNGPMLARHGSFALSRISVRMHAAAAPGAPLLYMYIRARTPAKMDAARRPSSLPRPAPPLAPPAEVPIADLARINLF